MSGGADSEHVITLYHGDERSIELQVKDDEGNPVDITTVDDIVVSFPNADGTKLEKKKSVADEVEVVSAALGKISVNLTEDEIRALKVDDYQDVFVLVDATEKRTYRFFRQLSVIKP